jgi:hypothetical protein
MEPKTSEKAASTAAKTSDKPVATRAPERSGETKAKAEFADLNSATKEQVIVVLPGFGEVDLDKYRMKTDL